MADGMAVTFLIKFLKIIDIPRLVCFNKATQLNYHIRI